MKRSFLNYKPAAAIGKALAAFLLWPQLAVADSSLELVTGAGRLAAISWEGIRMDYRKEPAGTGDWRIEIRGLQAGTGPPPLDLVMRCAVFRWGEHGPDCESAELTLATDEREPLQVHDVQIRSGPAHSYELIWQSGEERAQLRWSAASGTPGLRLDLDRLDLGRLPPSLLADYGLDLLAGSLSASLSYLDGSLGGSVRWADGLLDGFDGRIAAEGLDLGLEIQVAIEQGDARLSLRQEAGEILVGPVYLPPPTAPLEIELELQTASAAGTTERISIRRFALSDPESLVATGSAEWVRSDEAWSLQALDLNELQIALPAFWARWMEGPAAAAGFGGMELVGKLAGRLSWQSGSFPSLNLALEDVSLEDPRQRFALYGFSADVSGEAGSARTELAWQGASIWGLPLGSSGLAVHADELGARLLQPFAVPVLDGHVGIDSLAWLNLAELPSQLILDARIEPISLNLLTRELGLIELGGTLAGQFPGVRYQDQRLVFAGGIVIDAFSGQIMIEDLEIERPFGSLPALAAQVEFRRLDLLELTGAFDFGRMEGRMSGWMRDLRLLDWRAVAMDARLFTHEDVPRRRISQRAVDNLSSLGGAGGALLSGTLLRVFDDFPYRRAGLACRLSNNICYIDGVAAHESGGFLIVEGRGLPRLDVVGHRRLVDWPQLLRQLAAMRDPGDS